MVDDQDPKEEIPYNLNDPLPSSQDNTDPFGLRFVKFFSPDGQAPVFADNDMIMNENQEQQQLCSTLQPPTLTVSHMDMMIEHSTTAAPASSKNMGGNVNYNGDNVYLDTPPTYRTYNGNVQLASDDLLKDIDWDFGLDQNHSAYAESLTLGSESRTSNEFLSRASNEFFSRTSNELFYRTSNEFFDSSLTNVDSLEEVESRKSRIANSISNSLSSIFKNDNKQSRFNLRGINPLSTHRDPDALVQTLPNNLVDNVENLSIKKENGEVMKGRCVKNLHVENCDCVSKKKRSTTNSILNSLSNARLGFNSNKVDKKSLNSSVIKEENESESEIPDSRQPSIVEFDEELEMVISLASRHSSTYNFNSPRTSTNTTYTDALQTIPNENNDQIMEDGEIIDGIKQEKQSPDYAALFSNVGAPKKRSKTLSFKKKSQQLLQEEPAQSDDLEHNNDDDDFIAPSKSKIKEYPSVSEDGTIQIIPMKESTRGRKPSLEYDSTKTFVCTQCSRRFRRQEHLKRHFRSIHTNQKPFDCHLCNKKFSRGDNLAQHIKTHERPDL
jgi:uncharacterized Zn-finger protein